MTLITAERKQKYSRQLLAAALDLAARESVPPAFPLVRFGGRRLWRFAFRVEFGVLRLFSRIFGVKREFMSLFRIARSSVRQTHTNDA